MVTRCVSNTRPSGWFDLEDSSDHMILHWILSEKCHYMFWYKTPNRFLFFQVEHHTKTSNMLISYWTKSVIVGNAGCLCVDGLESMVRIKLLTICCY